MAATVWSIPAALLCRAPAAFAAPPTAAEKKNVTDQIGTIDLLLGQMKESQDAISTKLYALSTELGPLTERIDYLTTADASGGRDLTAAWARLNEISSQQTRLRFQWGDLEESTKFLSALRAELSSFLAADSDGKRRRTAQNIENLKAARARTQAKRAEEEKRLAEEEAEREQERLAARSPEARAAQEKAEEDRLAAERAEAARKADEARIAAKRAEDARKAAEAAARKAEEEQKLQRRKQYDDELAWASNELNKLRARIDGRADAWPEISMLQVGLATIRGIEDDIRSLNGWRADIQRNTDQHKEDQFGDDPAYKDKYLADRKNLTEIVGNYSRTANNQLLRAQSDLGYYNERAERYSEGYVIGVWRDIIAFVQEGYWALPLGLLSLWVHCTWPLRLAGVPAIIAIATSLFIWFPGFYYLPRLIHEYAVLGREPFTDLPHPLLWRLQTGSFLLALAYPVIWLFFWKKELAAQKRRLDGIWEQREAARLARLQAQQEAAFYGYATPAHSGASAHGAMTVNVRTPIQWSEWLAIAYWIMKMVLLAIPAVLILAGTGKLIAIAAALVPTEWRDEVVQFLQYIQDKINSSPPQ